METKDNQIKESRAVSRRNALVTLGGSLGLVGATILAGCGSGGGGSHK